MRLRAVLVLAVTLAACGPSVSGPDVGGPTTAPAACTSDADCAEIDFCAAACVEGHCTYEPQGCRMQP